MGEHGGESRQSHGGAEGTKSDRAVVYVLLITLVINVLRNLVNPLLCNEVDKNINKTRKYPLFLHASTVPLCSPLLCVTYLQTSNLKRYHSKLLKIQKCAKLKCSSVTLSFIYPVYKQLVNLSTR